MCIGWGPFQQNDLQEQKEKDSVNKKVENNYGFEQNALIFERILFYYFINYLMLEK